MTTDLEDIANWDKSSEYGNKEYMNAIQDFIQKLLSISDLNRQNFDKHLRKLSSTSKIIPGLPRKGVLSHAYQKMKNSGKFNYTKPNIYLIYFIKFILPLSLLFTLVFSRFYLFISIISTCYIYHNQIISVIQNYKHFYVMQQRHERLERYILTKPVRSWSGVLPVTLTCKPSKFSCPKDCYMCPNETIANGAEKDMPRSYLSTEPAFLRADSVGFDTKGQFDSRITTLKNNGHTVDKIEIIVLGGTFSSYPTEYQIEFCRDIFYAANVFENEDRDRLSLEEEQKINETAKLRIIGISLETRPDFINERELRKFRRLGCTRIQIGVQHTDNKILEIINRGHDIECSIRAVKLIKDWGFKLDVHLMPDLPGATPDSDKKMFDFIFSTSHICADYMKIYPCLDVKYTEIRKWKEQGRWKPYAEQDIENLISVLIHAKKQIPKWLRINRLQRDFPHENKNNNYVGFASDTIKSNLRQILLDRMKKDGLSCKCIRCREVKDQRIDISTAKISIEKYPSSDGTEFYIEMQDPIRDILYGFVRLRLTHATNNHKLPELRDPDNIHHGAALIRELHVYGILKTVNNRSKDGKPQHYGFGKQLMRIAEITAFQNNYTKMAVISGIGVRKYYEHKMGYHLEGTYMTKKLTRFNHYKNKILSLNLN
tara:strand:+ start:1853 stop:3820 length:1968 start_codon:yes stop_codon:yes gene_type:complete